MANVLYPSGSENLLKGNFHLCTSDQGVLSGTAAVLINNNYTYGVSHEFYSSSVAGGGANVVAGPIVVGSVGCVTGTLTGSDVTFSSVAAGQTVRHVVIFQSGTLAGTNDYLLANFETGSGGTEINISTNGGDITISWATNGILTLSGGC